MMKIFNLLVLLCIMVCLSACSGGSNAPNSPVTLAVAGLPQNATPMNKVTLDGSKSVGANGSLITYQWSFVSIPLGSTAILANATTVNASFYPDLAGVYTVKLKVTDTNSNSSESETVITLAKGNSAPTANAGDAQNVLTAAVVTLDGSKSSDVDNNAITYAWTITTKPVGSAATLTNAAAVKPTFTADVAGQYILTLVVNDGNLPSAPSTVTITATTSAVTNAIPVANAGVNATASIGQLVTLDGSGSSDANGDTLTYSWSITSKPAGSGLTVLINPTSAKPTFTADVAGSYVFNLVVNDGKDNSNNIASVTISTSAAPKAAAAFTANDAATGVTVTVPANAYDGNATQPVITVAKNSALPAGATLPANGVQGDTFVLNKDYANGFLQPVDITVPYDPAVTALPAVYYYDTVSKKYVAAQIQEINATTKTILFSTIHFSHYVIMSSKGVTASATTLGAVDTTFKPQEDGFFHPNFGSLSTPAGCALGMSDLAIWYFVNKKGIDATNLLPAPNNKGLYNKWREGDIARYQDDVTAKTVISAVQKAASQVWTHSWKQSKNKLTPQQVGLLLIGAMNVTGVPQTLLMKAVDTTGADVSANAVVVYKYTPDTVTANKGKFSLYDPNFPGEEVTIDWSTTGGFSGYSKAGAYSAVFTKFAFDGLNSIGDSKQYESLVATADSSLATITLTSPTPIVSDVYTEIITGTTISSVNVAGSVTGLPNIISYVLNGGALQYTTITNGAFSFTLNGTDLKSDNTLMIAAVGDPRDPWSFTGFKQLNLKYTGTSVNAFVNFGFEDSATTPTGWSVVPTYNSGDYSYNGKSTYMDRDVSGSPDPAASNFNSNWGHVSAFRKYSTSTDHSKSAVVNKSLQRYNNFLDMGTYNTLTNQYEYLTKSPGVDPVVDYYEQAPLDTYTPPTPKAPLEIASALGVTYNGNNALRVNNWDNSNHAGVASQTATIPAAANPELHFAWAAILEDPKHTNYDQPFVEVTVTDDDTGKSLYRKHFFSGDKTYSGWKSMTTNYAPNSTLWNIIPWQKVVVDVSSAVGHKVTVRVIASDCSLGGHGGYAYLDDAP
jgi:hypothetical protein